MGVFCQARFRRDGIYAVRKFATYYRILSGGLKAHPYEHIIPNT